MFHHLPFVFFPAVLHIINQSYVSGQQVYLSMPMLPFHNLFLYLMFLESYIKVL